MKGEWLSAAYICLYYIENGTEIPSNEHLTCWESLNGMASEYRSLVGGDEAGVWEELVTGLELGKGLEFGK